MDNKLTWKMAGAAMAGALVLLLLQHWGMTFTNSDDPWIVQLGYEKGLFQGSLEVAQSQGRFWLVPIKILAQLPFLFDSWPFVNILRMLVNGLVFVSFVLFCGRLTNRYAAILTGLVWLALIDINSSDFSVIHGYLLMFNLQFIFLFLSFYLFLKHVDQNRSGIVIAPYLSYAFALLAYEPMIFYSLVFPALYAYRNKERGELLGRSTIVEFVKRNWLLPLVLLLYLVMYFGFRKIFSEHPRGIDSVGNPLDIVKTIVTFSLHGFHVALKPLSLSPIGQLGIAGAVQTILFSMLVAFGLWQVIPRIRQELNPAGLLNKTSLLWIGFFVISPNILFGFVQGYRELAATDPHYVGNYFSSFPLAMLISLLVIHLVGGDKARYEKALFAVVIYILANSAAENYSRWAELGDSNRRGSALWQEVVQTLDQRTFPEGLTTLVCVGDKPAQVTGDDKHWSQYLSARYSSDIRLMSRRVNMEGCDVILDFQRPGNVVSYGDRSRNGAAGS